MGQEKISLSSPTEGLTPRPLSTPWLGSWDNLRQQAAVYPGQAISWKASDLAADALSVYLYGDALARPEFGGVCTTEGQGPSNINPISVSNSDGISALKCGYMAVMMAPGEKVQRDQWIEPIAAGPYQGLFRAATSAARAKCQSLQAFDDTANAGGSVPGRMCSAFLFLHPGSEGLIGATGPSDVLTGVTTETPYAISSIAVQQKIAANSAKVGSRYRASFAIRAANGASGATLFKAYLASAYVTGVPVSGSIFYSSISTTPGSGDVVQVSAELYVSALSGSNNVSLAGTATVGAPGTATARSLGIYATFDPTVDNYLVVTDTPNNNADQSQLLFLSLEKVG